MVQIERGLIFRENISSTKHDKILVREMLSRGGES